MQGWGSNHRIEWRTARQGLATEADGQCAHNDHNGECCGSKCLCREMWAWNGQHEQADGRRVSEASSCRLQPEDAERRLLPSRGECNPEVPGSIGETRFDVFPTQPMVEVYKARTLTAHVLDLARSSGASVPGYEVAVKHIATVEAQAGPNADLTGIYGAVRMESGLSFKNEV